MFAMIPKRSDEHKHATRTLVLSKLSAPSVAIYF